MLDVEELLDPLEAEPALVEVALHGQFVWSGELAVDEGIESAPAPKVADHRHPAATPAAAPPFRLGPAGRSERAETGHYHPGVTPDTSGDSERDRAFRRYVVPEIDVMYRVALSITRNPPDAEDLVQDSLLRAYRAVERFDGRHPRAWLLTIVRNAQINRVRRKRPELMRDPDATMAAVADTSVESRDVESTVVDSAFDSAVEKAFLALPEKFRAVVELVDLGGLPYQEAADALDIPVGTVMSRLHRARRRIRRQLEADHIDHPHEGV